MPKRGCTGYREIAARLRDEWLAAWRPGQRLPTNQEYCLRFGTTPVTMQRAMALLAEQGFVVTRPTVGTFLAERPPNTRQVGLIFPGHPGDIVNFTWSLNYLANLTVARELNDRQDRWRIRCYMDVSSEVGSKGLAKLSRDIADDVLAGLLFSYTPSDMKGHPLIKRPPLPIVHYNPNFGYPGMALRTDTATPLRAGLQWLRRRGARQVAVLLRLGEDLAAVHRRFAAAGLELRPEWILSASPYHTEWVAGLVASLFRDDGRERPDGLLITDDHLVEPAVTALLELAPPGLDRLAIFAHWNFPLPYSGRLPIARFGFDANTWLDAGLDLIARHPRPPRGKGEVATIPLRLVEGDDQGAASAPVPSFGQLIHQAREELLCTVS